MSIGLWRPAAAISSVRLPGCELQAAGSGGRPCMRCALARRVTRAVAAQAALLGQAWTRELFTAFCGLRRERGDMPRHVRRYAAFFAVIDKNCASAADVTQDHTDNRELRFSPAETACSRPPPRPRATI